MEFHFTWDPNKARFNEQKHGISFEKAVTAFADDHALLIPDPDHSDAEDRFVILGISFHLRILAVCHCYRQKHEIIRIISARRVTRREHKQYEYRRKL